MIHALLVAEVAAIPRAERTAITYPVLLYDLLAARAGGEDFALQGEYLAILVV